MFANAVPPIIEGIFHDLCIICGTTDNELLSEGFQEKLNRLKKYLVGNCIMNITHSSLE